MRTSEPMLYPGGADPLRLAEAPPRATPTWLPVAVLLGAIALLACYAMYLNRTYYAWNGPFYDSLSYMTQLARVMGTVRMQNMEAALRVALQGQTVFFPWLEGALLALVVNPAREQAVLIQLPLVIAQALGAYIFFRRVARHPESVSVCFALVTVGFLAVFKVDGGLSDLRLDLSQALAFGAAVAFLCVARATQNLRYWIVFGVVLGVAFLFRATTPVYAVLLVGVAAVLDAVLHRDEIVRRAIGYATGGAVALLISLWFYIVNIRYLYYYYFVWNYDANARLPLAQSIKHVEYLRTLHLGQPVFLLLLGVLACELFYRWRAGESFRRGLNWLPLLAGILPLAFLVLFGAALNPYVSMVSVPGFAMFALAPYARAADAPRHGRVRTLAYALAAVVAILTSVPKGIDTHSRPTSPWTPTMSGLRELSGALHKDLQARRKQWAGFEVTYAGGLDQVAVINSLAYDQGYMYDITGYSHREGVAIQPMEVYGPGLLANPVQWNAVPGATGEEKVKGLAATALKRADYLIVPEPGSELPASAPSTPYAFVYRALLVSQPGVVRIAGPIQVSPKEAVSIYWNGNVK